MRKNVFGRRLKRDTNERKALFKGLMSSLVLQERIKTTQAKAKAIKGALEKLVTKAKKKGGQAKREFGVFLTTPAMEKMISSIAPRFINRPGGYIRIVRLNARLKDNASMVLMEWVEGPIQNQISNIKYQKENKKEKKRKEARKQPKVQKPTKKTEKEEEKPKRGIRKAGKKE